MQNNSFDQKDFTFNSMCVQVDDTDENEVVINKLPSRPRASESPHLTRTTSNKAKFNEEAFSDIDAPIKRIKYGPRFDVFLERKDIPYQTFDISGIEIKFPYQPYPSQLEFITKNVEALQTRENALLESPTGTGKTLALLCSSLGWQFEEKRRIISQFIEDQAFEQQASETFLEINGENSANFSSQYHLTDSTSHFNTLSQGSMNPVFGREEPDSAQALPSSKRAGASTSGKNQKLKIPVIYYGTRTHRQIAQVVEELRTKTPYLPKMTILGSRAQYCIHHLVSKETNKDESCRELCKKTANLNQNTALNHVSRMRIKSGYCKENTYLNPNDTINKDSSVLKKAQLLTTPNQSASSGIDVIDEDNMCPYIIDYQNLVSNFKKESFLRELHNGKSKSFPDSQTWDIEDLVMAGKKAVACPYYTARDLTTNADIIFCPYNYLINPFIRKAMNIKLEGNIFIIDEAHNIEDNAREAASFEVEDKALDLMDKELACLADNDSLRGSCIELRRLGMILRKFMSTCQGYVKEESDLQRRQYVWHTKQFWAFLETEGMGSDMLPILELNMNLLKINKKSKGDRSSKNMICGLALELTEASERTLDGLLEVLNHSVNHATSFKIVITQSISTTNMKWTSQLGFWCLDSGVVFSELSKRARSVILTSGTLSPLRMFSSELSTLFKYTLEGSHVIQSNQVWAGVVPVGPRGSNLTGVYSTVQKQEYQDDIGDAILKIISKTPGGVLCFMPSYAMMEKLIKRWERTGVRKSIENHKTILVEPRNSSAVFDKFVKHFKKLVISLHKKSDPIVFAVFRGKLSEGIDFRDAECRCVISIGIPYPYFKDLKVQLKKDFNDLQSQEREMLSGSSWYNIQGFRAINQALGRCIRHQNDWGAIILLEQRFTSSSYSELLSKWIKDHIIIYPNFNQALDSVSVFFSEWQEHPPRRLETIPPPIENEKSAAVESLSDIILDETPDLQFVENVSVEDRFMISSAQHNEPVLLDKNSQSDSSDEFYDCIEDSLSLGSLGTSPERIVCHICGRLLFQVDFPYALKPPSIFSMLDFPTKNLSDYELMKLNSSNNLTSLNCTTQHDQSSSSLLPVNSYHDMKQGVTYGYLSCKYCFSLSHNFPIGVQVLALSQSTTELLCNSDNGHEPKTCWSEWIWIHSNLLRQLKTTHTL